MKALANPTRLAVAAAALIAANASNAQDETAPASDIAFLGVATAPVDEVVAAQLDLPQGVGAAVKIVVPDSPAEVAGVKKNDILFEFSGAEIRSPEHLSELVRTQKTGDAVPLGIIHRGQKKELSVILGSRPDDLPEAQPEPGAGQLDLGDLGAFDLKLMPLDGDFADLDERMAKMREQMEKHFKGMIDLDQLDNLPGLDIMSSSRKSVSLHNPDGSSISVQTNDGDTQVTAKDPAGKILFDGPANTEEEIAKMPDSVREMFDKTKGSDVDFNFGGFRHGRPKMKLPELKPGKKVEPEKEEPAIPPAQKAGKKVEL